jgi:hypothetical protein
MPMHDRPRRGGLILGMRVWHVFADHAVLRSDDAWIVWNWREGYADSDWDGFFGAVNRAMRPH